MAVQKYCRWLSLSFVMVAASATGAEKLTFERDIRPILKTHCFHCHGEAGETKAGLDVRLRRFLEKGGKSGPAIVPGDSGASHLIEVLASGDMPKEKPRLPEADIAKVAAWIDAGAPTARPEPEQLGDGYLFTEEDRAWWSFQPVDRPPVPKPDGLVSKNPVDAFLAAKMKKEGLEFSPRADARTLIRRLSFDLTGLPPTPQRIDKFIADSATNAEAAWAELIDELLASPAYGERWGRHWLDVAGYADSDGYSEKDLERKNSWRYRDYVIAAFNEDKPFDEFIREQLAGDEIAAGEKLHVDIPGEALRKRHRDLLVATGFLRMAPDGTGAKNNLEARNQCIADTIKIVSSSIYGMTIGCAQCHDHRYDAISHADYYRLRAVFEPGFDVPRWRNPARRLVTLQTAEDKATAAAIEEKAKKIDAERVKKQNEFIREVLGKLQAEKDEAIRADLHKAYETAVKERTPEQIALLKKHPKINQLSASTLYLYDTKYKTKHAATIKEMVAEAKKIRDTKPPVTQVQAFTEVALKPTQVTKTHIFHRGDFESPTDEVKPGDLSVLDSWREVQIPENTEALPTTGRRLAYARSITDGEHPLLARVMVNRVWMHHFGTGIVASAGDFGVLGERPSHPRLLDWLAMEFVEKGWSIKELHRLILQSYAFQQRSLRTADRDKIDPDNRLLSRQNSRRLQAEILRDALLAVSGKLNPKIGGEAVPVCMNAEGQVVIGADTTDSAGRQTGKFIDLKGEEFRRSIYVQVRRTQPLEMFAAFDAPDMMEPNCDVRSITTVSPQSLLLMNNIGMREHAQHFAMRLQAESPGDVAAQIDRAFQLAYGRPPTKADFESSLQFVAEQTAYYTENPAKLEKVSGPPEKENAPADLLGLAALGHALMSANEFLYVD
ncbi:MAG: PSD1 and planctomycete cytochrome C domain-containing protein [Verrucomicrobiales bacterium]|nr:PSD1 and planctomycete cytochrome C domain-containing protein [Verrucomicrobiales bacterium]